MYDCVTGQQIEGNYGCIMADEMVSFSMGPSHGQGAEQHDTTIGSAVTEPQALEFSSVQFSPLTDWVAGGYMKDGSLIVSSCQHHRLIQGGPEGRFSRGPLPGSSRLGSRLI